MTNLKAKRILFVGPVFHDYHLLIIKELTQLGAYVDFIPERNYSLWNKFLNMLLRPDSKVQRKKHYLNYWHRLINNHYDYLYVVRGNMLPTEFLDSFSQRNPSAIRIMYQWDSERMNPFTHLLNFFDVTYSFDFKDCSDNKRISYLPLFYTQDIKEEIVSDIDYDLFFMGWYLPERYSALIKMKRKLKGSCLRMKNFIYLPFTSFIKELLHGNFSWDYDVISFHSMSRKDYIYYLNRTRAVVDVSNKLQTGLAIRIMEAFSLKKKIITNNSYIKNVPNIPEGQVLIFDDETDMSVIIDFLNKKVDNYYHPLSITDWLITQFEQKQ